MKIQKDKALKVEWLIARNGGGSFGQEFGQNMLYVWVNGQNDRWCVYSGEGVMPVSFDFPTGLEAGEYTLEAIWATAESRLRLVGGRRDSEFDTSVVRNVVTLVDDEADEDGSYSDGEVLTVVSTAEGMRKEGLDAYELACLRGETAKESEWLNGYVESQGALEALVKEVNADLAECKEMTEAATEAVKNVADEVAKGEALREELVKTEAERESNETERKSAEATRVSNESARNKAEGVRIAQEQERVEVEKQRRNAEELRAEAEATREAQESARQSAEDVRVANETARATAENERKEAESERVNAETARKEAETARVEAETARVSAENAREVAEQKREADFTTLHDETEAAVTTLVSEAEAAVNEAKSATEATNKAISDAQEATTRANSAAEKCEQDAEALADLLAGAEATETEKGLMSAEDKMTLDNLASVLYLEAYDLNTYEEGQLDPEPVKVYGNKEQLSRIYPYLIDTTAQDGQYATDFRRLMKNNWLRFANGGFAPTVGISEAQRAECDVALWLDAAQGEKYCEAGAFDAEAFYEAYGMDQKLYNESGAEVRILRPWETTETKYTIGLAFADEYGNPVTVTVVDGMTGKSGQVWRGILPGNVDYWDGMDLRFWKLKPTAFSPGLVTTIGGKTRSFFYQYNPNTGTEFTNTRGDAGQGGCCTAFLSDAEGMMYPRVSDVTQITLMNFARANNSDTDSPVPFGEGGFHAYNALAIANEVRFGTKYLHKNTLFGSGISRNESITNETTWRNSGGGRVRVSGDSAWNYVNWDGSSIIYYNAEGKRAALSATVNKEYPKEGCLESQMAASYAAERSVAEDVEFEFYGKTYRYVNVTGGEALLDGGMDVKIYSVRDCGMTAWNSAGEVTQFDCEVNLRMSLCQGLSFVGDIWGYCGGGHELVGTITDNTTQGADGAQIECFVMPDQSRWVKETTIMKKNLGKFDFEDTYYKTGESTGQYTYIKQRWPFSIVPKEKGGGLAQGECAYWYAKNYYSSTANSRTRLGSRFRGYANYANCSWRFCLSSFSAGNAGRNSGGLAQVCLRPTQSE